MKCIIFRGIAPFNLGGSWGDLVIEGRGIINRVDQAKWNLAYKQYRGVIDDFVSKGLLEVSETKDGNTPRDENASLDALKDAQNAQNKNQSKEITNESNETKPKPKSENRIKLENFAISLGIQFDDNMTNKEIGRLIEAKKAEGSK